MSMPNREIFKKCKYRNSGPRCLKKAVNGSDMCAYHAQEAFIDTKKQINDDCPICLEIITREDKIHVSQCNHGFHVECMINMVSMKCPICREHINNIPENVVEMIDKKKSLRRRESNNHPIGIGSLDDHSNPLGTLDMARLIRYGLNILSGINLNAGIQNSQTNINNLDQRSAILDTNISSSHEEDEEDFQSSFGDVEDFIGHMLSNLGNL